MDAATSAGFDVYSGLTNGRAVTNTGFAAMSVEGQYGLYWVNLLTGDTYRFGLFPAATQVFDIAVRPASVL